MAIQPAVNLVMVLGLRIGGDLDGVTYYVNKKGKTTWFAKAPPTSPPTFKQQSQRNRFRQAATLWQLQTKQQRAQWELLARRASLCMTGYNLFVHIHLTLDFTALATLQSQTGIPIT